MLYFYIIFINDYFKTQFSNEKFVYIFIIILSLPFGNEFSEFKMED